MNVLGGRLASLSVTLFALLGCGVSKVGTPPSGAAGSGSGEETTTPLSPASLEGFGGLGIDLAFALSASTPGRVTLTGASSGTVDWGGGPLSPSNGYAQFVVTLDDSGNHVSSMMATSADNQNHTDIATGTDGKAVMVGAYEVTMDWGGVELLGSPPSAADSPFVSRVFAVGLDSDGTVTWGDTFESPATFDPPSVALDQDGNAFVAGASPSTRVNNELLATIFLTKLDSLGHVTWTKQFSSSSSGLSTLGLTVDSEGNVVLLGLFRTDVDFGAGPLTSVAKYGDIFVAKFDPNGELLWNRAAGGTRGGTVVGQVAVNRAGEIAVLAPFSAESTFGATTADAGPSDEDVLAVKLDASGSPLWVRRARGVVTAAGIAIDERGRVLVIGDGRPTFLAEPAPANQPSFVVEYDEDGDIDASLLIAGESTFAASIAIATDGDVFISGSYGHTLQIADRKLSGADGSNIYVAKLNPSPPLP